MKKILVYILIIICGVQWNVIHSCQYGEKAHEKKSSIIQVIAQGVNQKKIDMQKCAGVKNDAAFNEILEKIKNKGKIEAFIEADYNTYKEIHSRNGQLDNWKPHNETVDCYNVSIKRYLLSLANNEYDKYGESFLQAIRKFRDNIGL